MDDLGPPIEASPDFFSCVAEAPIGLEKANASENCANLLASSSRFGYVVAARKVTLSILKLVDLHNAKSPTTDVDLSSLGINAILSVQFVFGDTVLAVHADFTVASILLLRFPALISGTIDIIASPKGAIIYTAYTDPNPVDTPTSQLIASVTSSIHLNVLTASSFDEINRIDAIGPLSIALSPSTKLLAIGTQRGSIAIHLTSDGSLAGTIVEVESGWIPFALHFVNEESLVVAYTKDNMTSYVMRTLILKNRTISVRSHYSFGELCLPSDDTGDGEDPNIMFNTIPCWDMCLISSSASIEVEIIAMVDTEWQCWKLDESRAVYLPTNDEGLDTPAIGSIMDFTDMKCMEPQDPSAPMIQLVPRLLVLTSEFRLLPFSLVDQRPNSKCDLVRMPSELPQVLSTACSNGTTSASTFSVPKVSNDTTGESSMLFEANSRLKEKRRSTPNPDLKGTSQTSDVVLTPVQSPFAGEDKLTQVVLNTSRKEKDTLEGSLATRIPPALPSSSSSNPFYPSIKPSPFSSSFAAPPILSSPSALVKTFAKTDTNGGSLLSAQPKPGPLKRDFFLKPPAMPPRRAFLESERFLAHFSDSVEIKNSQSIGVAQFNENENISSPKGKESMGTLFSRESRAPMYSLEPLLEEAITTASTGQREDTIKSMLHEMSEELAVGRNTAESMAKELNCRKQTLARGIELTRSDLARLLESGRKKFATEIELRKEVASTLKQVLTVSRAYESLSLELRVEETTGTSRGLKQEDIIIDEKIDRRESDILKCVASIENRLTDEVTSKQQLNPSEVVQELFSSLSLQGIRIKRVTDLLKSLSQRLEKHDNGGRQSYLGLSLARLEHLSLESESIGHSETMDRDQSTQGNRQALQVKGVKLSDTSAISPQGDDPDPFSSDIRSALRRLAMCDGREHVSPSAKVSRNARQMQNSNSASIDMTVTRSRSTFPRKHSNSAQNKVGTSFPRQIQSPAVLEGSSKPIAGAPDPYRMNAYEPVRDPLLRISVDSLRDSALSTRTKPSLLNRGANKVDRNSLNQQNASVVPHVSSSESQYQTSAGKRRSPDAFSTESSPSDDIAELSKAVEKRSYQAGESAIPSPSFPSFRAGVNTSVKSTIELTSGKEVKSKIWTAKDYNPPISGASAFYGKEDERVVDQPHLQPKKEHEDGNPREIIKTSPRHETSVPSPKERSVNITSNPSSIPVANLPPDDTIDSKSETSSVKIPLARLPPDDFERPVGLHNNEKISKTKESKPPQEEADAQIAGLSLGGETYKTKVTPQLKSGAENSEKEMHSSIGSDSNTKAFPSFYGSSQFTSGSSGPSFASSDSNVVQGLQGRSDAQLQDSGSTPGKSTLFPANPSSSGSLLASSKLFREGKEFVSSKKENAFGESGSGLPAASSGSSKFGNPQSHPSLSGTSSLETAMHMNRTDNSEVADSRPFPFTATDSEDSDENGHLRQGMDTSIGDSSSFTVAPQAGFGLGDQSSTSSMFGHAFASAFGATPLQQQQAGQSNMNVSSSSDFREQQSSPFVSSSANYGSHVPSGFGTSSGFGAISPFSMASSMSTTAPVFGNTSAIGMNTTFGSTSPIGAQNTSFTMPTATFGESSFGNQSGQASQTHGFGGTSFGIGGGASPFGALSGGAGFSGSSASQSGFAALAANSSGLVFGNGNGPPAFTSAAFTQRRG